MITTVDPMSSAESSRLPATGTVKHYGTYYVREGGMSGVPNQLWKQLTSLLGDNDDDNTDTIPVDEQIKECETNSSLGTVHGNAAPQFIGINSFGNQHLSGTGPNGTGYSDACKEAEVGEKGVEVVGIEGVDVDIEDVDENDDSDAGSVVEIGIDECCMLKQCLTRKLDSLLSTNERYALSILFNYSSVLLYDDLIQQGLYDSSQVLHI